MVSGEMLLSIHEVNQRLPLVRSIVRDIVELHSDVRTRRTRLQAILDQRPSAGHVDSVYGDEVRQMEAELESDEGRLGEFQQELRQLGGNLTDPVTGTVDFPTSLQGDRVSLCWRPRDSQVMFWHAGQCSETGRIPLLHEHIASGELPDGDYPDGQIID